MVYISTNLIITNFMTQLLNTKEYKSEAFVQELIRDRDDVKKYIKEENKKSKKLFGGLVANTGSTTNNGRWVYFTDSGAKFKKGEFDNWTDLDL